VRTQKAIIEPKLMMTMMMSLSFFKF